MLIGWCYFDSLVPLHQDFWVHFSVSFHLVSEWLVGAVALLLEPWNTSSCCIESFRINILLCSRPFVIGIFCFWDNNRKKQLAKNNNNRKKHIVLDLQEWSYAFVAGSAVGAEYSNAVYLGVHNSALKFGPLELQSYRDVMFVIRS